MQQRVPQKDRDGKARDDCFEDGGSNYFKMSRREGHAGRRPKEDGVPRIDVRPWSIKYERIVQEL